MEVKMKYNKKEELLDKISGLMYKNPDIKNEWYNKGISDAFKYTKNFFNINLVPEVPQYVADWIKYCHNTGVTLKQALEVGEVVFYNYANQNDFKKLHEFMKDEDNQETFARAWLEGYEVKEEKRYFVKMKGHIHENILVYGYGVKRYFFSSSLVGNRRAEHTKKQLEEGGFGEVFDSPLFEVEEMKKND